MTTNKRLTALVFASRVADALDEAPQIAREVAAKADAAKTFGRATMP